MKCPACAKEQPMSFKCRFCGLDLVRQAAPPTSGASPRPAPPIPPPAPPPPPPPRAPRAAAPPPAFDTTAADPGGEAFNPYAAPRARVETPVQYGGPDVDNQAPLADRGARFVAQLLDGLLTLGAVLPGMFLMIVAPQRPNGDLSALGVIGVLLMLAGLIGLAIYQLRMLGEEGQTWGKKKMEVRIVMNDTGELPGLGRILGMRILVNGLIGAIPCVGSIYQLADPLFIFSEDRRCLHDRVAGTKVVRAVF